MSRSSLGPRRSSVAFEDFEDIKENLQPVRQGRRPDVLRIVCQSGGEFKKHMEERRQQFEADLKTAAQEDRLAIWERYLSWARQHFPTGGQQSGLLSLHERATRDLHDGGQRPCDRYVRLWLDYATLVSDPCVVFRFMDAHSIGVRDCRLYVTWATVLEALGRLSEAEAVFATARQRDAQPAAVLESYYTAFGLRNVQRMREQFNRLDGGLQDLPPPPPLRQPLGTLWSPNRKPGRVSACNPQSQRLINQEWTPWPPQTQPAAKRRELFSVHADDDAAGSSNAAPHDSIWRSLPSERQRRKENLLPSARWTETRVPSDVICRPNVPLIAVWEDNCEEGSMRGPATPAKAETPPALRRSSSSSDGRDPGAS